MADEPSFFFDYVDPLCWLWDRALTSHEDAGGARVRRHPLELRPPPVQPLDPEDADWRARWEAAMAGLPPQERPPLPRFVPWTRKAHELVLHAGEKGGVRRVHEALFHAYVAEGRDIGRVDVLVALAEGAGLDRSETKAVLDVDRMSADVVRLREEAERLGILGFPACSRGDGAWKGAPSRSSRRSCVPSSVAGAPPSRHGPGRHGRCCHHDSSVPRAIPG